MSMFRHFAFAAFLILSNSAAFSAPVTYTIGSKLSRANLSLQHQGFIELTGTLKITPGNFVFDNEDWSRSSVAVTMPIKSLDMGDALWNEQIRGDSSWKNLFAAPFITFRSTRLERSDASNGVLHGELSLAGVTRAVALQIRVNKIGLNDVTEKPSIGISGTVVIKRSQFGLDAYADLVGDALTIRIQLEASVGPDTDAQRNTQ